jgi:hypothetical protein
MRLLQIIKDGLELRRLRRRLPYVYRRFVNTREGIRTETNGEYLDRLRGIYTERRGQSRQRSREEGPTRRQG